jgi:hypothetical protein
MNPNLSSFERATRQTRRTMATKGQTATHACGAHRSRKTRQLPSGSAVTPYCGGVGAGRCSTL